MREKFWQLPLASLSETEWEALCDGCGKCCLVKLEDDNGSISYTSLACKFLANDGSCSVYTNRFKRNKDCMKISMNNVAESAYWLPKTCAYRLRFENKPLFEWHPLLVGQALSKRHSVVGKFISESKVAEEDYIDYIVIDENNL